MPDFAFQQVDVFATSPLKGNALAVVIGADALSDTEMAAFANWTNLAETTFLLTPTDPAADYRVRIFTPDRELPFAGHPTLGSAHVWLAQGGVPKGEEIVQQCGVGNVRIRREADQLAFAAPPLLRSGPVEPELRARLAAGFCIGPERIRDAHWVVNGPHWVAIMLESRAELLALRPDYTVLAGLDVGAVAPWSPAIDGDEAAFEVRSFTAGDQGGHEDPVTGSLNAGLAQWMIGAGLAPERYVASQGAAMGRAGRIHVAKIGDDIWIGGAVTGCIEGRLRL